MAFDADKTYGLYVHIPFCKSKCKYCAFISITDFSLQKKYVNAVVNEIKTHTARCATLDSVYIGGGTPSCLESGGIAEIFDAIYGNYHVSPSAEITVEANPESCDARFIKECIACGVNRVSLGLQSSDDSVLKAVGRLHVFDDFIVATDRIIKCGIDNISSDLIMGLPGQDISDIKKSISAVADRCAHMSVYALSVEDGTPLKNSGYVTDDDTIADMYNLACDELYKRGFYRYEVSNFAKPDKYSRHNSKYWSCEPYIGIGVAAHGYDGNRLRSYHGDGVADYIDSARVFYNELTDRDMYNEFIMLALRTERGIDLEKFSERFGYRFENNAAEKIRKLSNAGLVVLSGKNLRIASDKMFVMNGIIEELMC